MSTNGDKCGVASPADTHTGKAKADPYASEADTRALLAPDTRTPAEKHLDQLIQAESVAEMCGADYTQALRKAALKMVEAVIFVEPCCGKYETCTQDCVPRREFLAAKQQNSETVTQTFEGLPLRKLRQLLSEGWAVNGVSIQRQGSGGVPERGAVTTGGMVLWWNQAPAQQGPVRPVALTSKQRTLLAQAWPMLEDYAQDQRSHGNDVFACGAEASAHEIKTMLTTPPAAPVQEPVIQRVMSRLADLLDEDQFKEIEGMVVSTGCTPPAAVPMRSVKNKEST